MIVKDESNTITDCLVSVLPYIDHWIIVDTGSSDNTIEIIEHFFRENPVPGSIHQRPWVDYSHNRNEALDLAKDKADYALFMDADERLIIPDGFSWPNTNADAYGIRMQRSLASYWNLKLVRPRAGKWIGVVHEAFTLDEESCTIDRLPETPHIVSNRIGYRSKDPLTFEKDAALLRDALCENPKDTRSWFYLAQSYRDAGLLEQAAGAYLQRIELGGWAEEVYCALLELGKLQLHMNKPWAVPLLTLLSAYNLMPNRLEAIFEVVRRCREKEEYALGYALSVVPSQIRGTEDWLLVVPAIYEWRMLDERALCAIGTGRWLEAQSIYGELLRLDGIPDSDRERMDALRQRCVEVLSVEE